MTQSEFNETMVIHLTYLDFHKKGGARADFRGIDFTGFDLRPHFLFHARIKGALFVGARLNWMDHAVMSEICRAAATIPEHLAFVDAVWRSRELCWADFETLNAPCTVWSKGILQPYLHPDDPDDIQELFA